MPFPTILTPSNLLGGQPQQDLLSSATYDGLTSNLQYRNPIKIKCRFKIVGVSNIPGIFPLIVLSFVKSIITDILS